MVLIPQHYIALQIVGIKGMMFLLKVERGSVARDWDAGEEELVDRDQLYIRDGNAEILRLLTRGAREDRPHTLVQVG